MNMIMGVTKNLLKPLSLHKSQSLYHTTFDIETVGKFISETFLMNRMRCDCGSVCHRPKLD